MPTAEHLFLSAARFGPARAWECAAGFGGIQVSIGDRNLIQATSTSECFGSGTAGESGTMLFVLSDEVAPSGPPGRVLPRSSLVQHLVSVMVVVPGHVPSQTELKGLSLGSVVSKRGGAFKVNRAPALRKAFVGLLCHTFLYEVRSARAL